MQGAVPRYQVVNPTYFSQRPRAGKLRGPSLGINLRIFELISDANEGLESDFPSPFSPPLFDGAQEMQGAVPRYQVVNLSIHP